MSVKKNPLSAFLFIKPFFDLKNIQLWTMRQRFFKTSPTGYFILIKAVLGTQAAAVSVLNVCFIYFCAKVSNNSQL